MLRDGNRSVYSITEQRHIQHLLEDFMAHSLDALCSYRVALFYAILFDASLPAGAAAALALAGTPAGASERM